MKQISVHFVIGADAGCKPAGQRTGAHSNAYSVSAGQRLLAHALRSVPTDGYTSGLVVVGFGGSEIYPSWSHYSIGPRIGDKARWRNLEQLRIGASKLVDIRTFAQDDMAVTFLRGMHPELPGLLRGIVDGALGDFIAQMHQQLGGLSLPAQVSSYIATVENDRETIVNRFDQILNRVLTRQHYEPLESTVRLLPKEELADLAETLVGLTSFKRRMTPGLDSVGGPIDVALITKGDGLVWTKRKHYFGKELNMRYFERNRFSTISKSSEGDDLDAEE